MPLLVRYPGAVAPGTVTSDIVAQRRLRADAPRLAGVDVPTDMQGRSFAPLLEGETPDGLADVDVLPLLDAPRRRHTGARPTTACARDAQADLLLRRAARQPGAEARRPVSGSCSTSRRPARDANVFDDPVRARSLAELRAELARLQAAVGDHPVG